MANYNSNKAQFGVTPKWVPEGDLAVLAVYGFGTTGLPTLAANDTFTMQTIPANTYVTGVTLDVDKLDSGGTPSIKLNVGDASNAARYISQTTVAQAGGYTVPNVNGGLGYNPTSNTPVLITVQTAANGAVPASANVRLLMNYAADV